jgi:hypothetical protein
MLHGDPTLDELIELSKTACMLVGIPKEIKKARLRSMKFLLRSNGIKKFSTEPLHVERAFRRWLANIEEK